MFVDGGVWDVGFGFVYLGEFVEVIVLFFRYRIGVL